MDGTAHTRRASYVLMSRKGTLTNSAFALALAALPFFISACSAAARAGSGDALTAGAAARPLNFDEYMRADVAPADGCDSPLGDGEGGGAYTDAADGKRDDGWYVATRFAEQYSLGLHTGEDWNG